MSLAIEQLFKDARHGGGIQFVYSLIRVEGLRSMRDDEIKVFFRVLQAAKTRLKKNTLRDPEALLETLTSDYETYALIVNIVRNATGGTFRFRPIPWAKDQFGSDRTPPPIAVLLDELLRTVESYKEKNPAFHDEIRKAFSPKVFSVLKGEESFADEVEQTKAITAVTDFMHAFVKRYFRELVLVGRGEKLHPIRHPAGYFDVYEILSKEKVGLYGIKIHHANGSHSFFHRTETETQGINISTNIDGEVEIFVGDWSKMEKIWMVDGKPLYEIGIAGRYNAIGEWKPMTYPGDSEAITKLIREASKDEKDKRIEGCLFYVMATCQHVIEFVVKASFDINYDYLNASFGDVKVQLHKVKMPDAPTGTTHNMVVYDGTATLPAIDVKTIGDTLDGIGLFINRLAFRLDGKAEWFQKYDIYGSGDGRMHLDKRDFKVLGDYMMGLNSPDTPLLDTAMSWYNAGRVATNIFTQYLNYYIAIESLAVAFAEGDMAASAEYGIEKTPRGERKKRVEECIRGLHESEYERDPVAFAAKSYSECIRSLRTKTEKALVAVFGTDHECTKQFFDKSGGKSMYDLRNDLAHGNFNHVDRDQAHMVRNKLPLLKDIAYRFILRLSAEKGKKQKRFGKFSMSIRMDSPRGAMITTSLQMLPRKDWKLQWDWLHE